MPTPSERQTSPSQEDDAAQPRIDGGDRVMIMLIGFGVLLMTAAFTQINILIAIAAASALAVIVNLYGKRPKPSTIPLSQRRARPFGQESMFGERELTDHLMDGVWIIGPIGQIVYANKAAGDIWGDTEDGQRLTTITRAMPIQNMVRDALAGKATPPIAYHADTPTDMHLRICASPIMPQGYDDIRFRHALVVFRDETASEKAAVMQGDFLANASHELKTPIASLLGYIETLRGHAKDDPIAREKFLGIMQEQAERMQRLISDLLSLRQIEQTEHIAPNGKADFAVAAQRAIDAVSPMARKRGVKMIASDLSPQWVIGIEDELVQLCINIIDNAVKMSPKNSSVSVSFAQIESWQSQKLAPNPNISPRASTRLIVAPQDPQRAHVMLQVQDEGPGFSKDHLPRIGERFYRVMGDRAQREKGTGLGLAIVKHVVMRHRGGLHVKTISKPKDDIFGITDLGMDDSTSAEEQAVKTGTQFTAIIPAATDTQDAP